MSKEKILFVNHDMSIGGNVTSMISLLECIDFNRYEVDLLLYQNSGDLLSLVPEKVNLLPQAYNCDGKFGRIKKYIKYLFSFYPLKAYIANKKIGKSGFSYQVMSKCQVRLLSRRLKKEYDYAVGFFEGWADRYVADIVRARHKYGWYHSMFTEICPMADLELDWLAKVDAVATVSEPAYENFCEAVPCMRHKARYFKNVLSSGLVRNRADNIDLCDEAYAAFSKADCFKIITVCRLDVSSKALERAVLAAKRLTDDGYKFLWYIVGEGDDRELLQDMIDKNGLGNVIVLVGKRINPHPFVRQADVFCLTSRYEGKPMAITETMMLGTPPVVTEYASASDQISHGVDGRIAPNNDEAIYHELKLCLDDPDEVKKMREYLLSHEYGNQDYVEFLQNELFSEH